MSYRKVVALFVFTLAIGCSRDTSIVAPDLQVLQQHALTGAFSATVKGPMTLPIGCAPGVTVCGTAKIAGIGQADFTYTITAFQNTGGSCGD